MKLARAIRKFAKRAGVDLRRYRPLARDAMEAQRFLLRDTPCRVVFDIGAYQGDTIAQYTETFPDADIYAFEPFPETYERLSSRFAGNRRVHLMNVAVSSQSGEAVFHVNRHAATNSLLPRPASGRRYFPRNGDTLHTITVPTVTIDEFCAQRQAPPPDILKLDIQGNELAALQGAEKTLRGGQVSLIYTEVSFVPHYEGGVLFGPLCAHLSELGYSLFNLFDLQWATIGQLRFADALFVSDRLRQYVIDKLPDEP